MGYSRPYTIKHCSEDASDEDTNRRPRKVSDGQWYKGPSRNDPVVHQKDPKEETKPVKTEAELFVNTTIGSFTVAFEYDGRPVPTKSSHGYLTLRPKGGQAITRSFLIDSARTLPSRRVLTKELERYYSRSSTVKLIQLHLDKAIA